MHSGGWAKEAFVQPSDVGVYLPADVGRAELQSMCGRLEEQRYHSIWFTETDLVRDPLVHASGAAVLTDRLGVGVGLVNVWKQLPVALATAVANLDGLAPGRCSVVLGPWHEPAATQAGVRRHHLLEAMRDTTVILRRLLRGETVSHTGRVYSVDSVSMPGRSAEDDIPLVWGANGPRMVAAAADLVAEGLLDGVMVNYLTSPTQVRDVIDEVAQAAVSAGRARESLHFPTVVIASMSDDKTAALQQMRSAVEGSAVLRAEARFAPDGPVSIDELDARMAAGSPAQCRERLEQFLAAGARPVAVYSRDPVTLVERLFQT
jgi:alkanesulfonate monooxygenase SsuD/methylene tetrahydromethanopterin reductase-like flavin-dependent oxidoreductase (luciferase family)